MAFGEHLRRLRGRLGISQEKLAERASLSRTSVVNIEAGRQGVALATLYRLAEALGTGPGELLPSMSQGEGTPSIAIGPENDDSTRIIRSVMKDLADRRGEE
jgi:transcriptional regulator with XRE-family HTH domain